jgi:phosphate uptake regulator
MRELSQRRLIKHGPSSMIISLPAVWVREQALTAGDLVHVRADGDKLIVSSREQRSLSEATYDIDGLDRTSVRFLIRAAYRMGYTRITLRFTEKSRPHYRLGTQVPTAIAVLTEVNCLIGVEVTQQREGTLVIQEITRPSALELPVLYRKAFTMVHQLILQLAEEDPSVDIGVEDRHDVITKIISYLMRIVAVGESQLAQYERERLVRTLAGLDVFVDMLKYHHRDHSDITKSFVLLLAELFKIVESLVFTKDRKLMTQFEQTRQKLKEQSLERLLPSMDVLRDIVILHCV